MSGGTAVLTCAQIITLANQMSKTPGYTSQAGQMFNAILAEIAMTYELDSALGYTNGTFSGAQPPPANSPVVAGSGPYTLPADFLRVDRDDFWWSLLGVMYFPIAVDIAEFDRLVQIAGNNAYPSIYAVDMTTSPPGLYVWPTPSGSYPWYMRYHKQNAAVVTPETAASVPWFPLDTYMITRLAGEMMKIANDDRWQAFLGKGPEGAQGILDRFLQMQGNHNTRAVRITLDRRRFGTSWNRLPNTKQVGW